MIDRVAAEWGRRDWSRNAELVVDVQAPLADGPRRLRGDLDQLVDRLEALGHAALAELPGEGSVVLTIEEEAGRPPPTMSMPRSRLLRFQVQATGTDGVEPASAPYFFEQVFAPGAALPAAPPVDRSWASLHALRVLAIDDNMAASRVLLQLAHALGLALESVPDAEGAVRALAQAHQAGRGFDLVLLDARLPPPDALACARRVRESSCRAPVLLMAGPGDAGMSAQLAPDQAFGRELGVVGVLRKPLVDGASLARACLAALQRPPQLPRPATSFPSPSLTTMTLPAAPVPAVLPALPGIDTAIGRASTMNNEKLYRRLLIKFREAQQGAIAQVAQAWHAGDGVLARRLAHDLASVSGTLGAMRLHDVARRLEAICAGEADAAGLPEALASTGEELARVLEGLRLLGAE